MRIRKNIVRGLLCVSVCLAGGVGCSRFDVEEHALVSPASDNGTHVSNFQAGELVSERFEWSRGQNRFCLNIPEAGDYLLTYVTLKDKDSSSTAISAVKQTSSFAIAFRANAPAYVSIGLEQNEALDRFVLQQGAIKPEAVGLYDDGPIIRYASPSIPTIFWKDVFTLASERSPLALEKSVLPCPPLLSTDLEWR